MKSNKHKAVGIKGLWVSYQDSERYRRFQKKRASNHSDLEIELNNRSSLDFDRVRRSIQYLSKMILGKFAGAGKWRLKVWLEEQEKNDKGLQCKVELVRPRQSNLFVRKDTESLQESLRRCLKVLEKSVRREGVPHATSKPVGSDI